MAGDITQFPSDVTTTPSTYTYQWVNPPNIYWPYYTTTYYTTSFQHDHCYCDKDGCYKDHLKCCKCGDRMHKKFVKEPK